MAIQRTGFYPVFIAFKTLTVKEIMRFLRIWTQTLLPPAITMSLYFVIFGEFIGSQISDIEGFSYMKYIVPGLVMMSIMTNAYTNTATSFFLTKFNKSIEEMIVSPMPVLIILLGFTFGGILRGILVGIIVSAISLFFTHIPVHSFLIIFLMSILVAGVFSIGGLINGILAKRFDDIALIPTFVLTPLTYFGGVFYSVNQLPAFWRSLSICNPVLYMIDTFRYGFLGVSDLNIYIGLGLVSLLFIALFAWSWYLLKTGKGIKA